ncbi:MAG: PD-(D/E)XK nuclease family protein [Alphaproteobacteria bacterium]|nr:PD-(D/E)XK nuclease family protein [Alphaproteobacteria bacterium]
MSSVDAWLDDRVRPPKTLARPILVLCRTDATLATVRSWAARRRGLTGFDVATPRMLAAQLGGPRLDAPPESDDTLPDVPFARRLRDRPGLVALARQRTQELRRTRAADPAVRAPAWLAQLADTTWAVDTPEEIRLLELARAHGPHLTASLGWSRVVAIGFDVPLDPWTRAVTEALTQQPAAPVPAATRMPDRALVLADPVAEARQAALLASGSPNGALILVQHAATAARVHRALLRNGVPSAWRGASRLERHGLASVIRRCVPWFAGSANPNIRATDLHEVLRHPLIARRLPPPAETWLTEQLTALGDPHPERTWLSPRDLTRAIKRCRHLDAPLSRWTEEAKALMERDDEPRTPARMARFLARLGVLEASIRGVEFREIFGTDAPEEEADWGEFDALITSLIGDQDPDLPPPLAPSGTLGALRRFLLACKVRTRDDPGALRILGALRNGADRPATRTDVLQVLVGSVARAECAQGVEIVAYEDYDGRPCDVLVLCDVHDQGVAARPRPDPLLSDVHLTALGQLDARARVRFRLEQLQTACARAGSSTALVCQHDTMGRAVVPPVQLDLRLEPAGLAPYGLDADLPEVRALSRLQVAGPGPAPTQDALGRLAIQATAEWYRAGRGPVGSPPLATSIPGRDTLAHLLASRVSPPAWIEPLLGVDADVPQAHLEPAERSVTRFFEPLAHCMYQAFVRNVLRVDEPDTLSAELDAREIGQAVHDALEGAVAAGGWNHAGDQDAMVARFLEALAQSNGGAFDAARSSFGALSPARLAATRGLEARWSTHWAAWARSRTLAASSGFDPEPLKLALDYHVAMDRAETALRRAGEAAGLVPLGQWGPRNWLRDILRGQPDPGMPTSSLLVGQLPGAWERVARDFLTTSAFERLKAAVQELVRLENALTQPLLAAVAELRFGSDSVEVPLFGPDGAEQVQIGPITLKLGDHEVPARGAIDRVLVVGVPHEPLLRVGDYKSGANAPLVRDGLKQLLDLQKPQLVVYALVLRQAVREGLLGGVFAGASVATVGWDHLRATQEVAGRLQMLPARDRYLLDDQTLDLLGRALGSLVKRAEAGSWPLSPRGDTCPKLKSYAHDHCPYASACRFRALPGEARR